MTLADRFPPAEEAALADADRAALLQMRDDYRREFRRHFARLRQLLTPVATVGGTNGPEAASWQDDASAILGAAKSLDSAVSACFASAAPTTAPPDQMVQRLQTALREAAAAAGGLR